MVSFNHVGHMQVVVQKNDKNYTSKRILYIRKRPKLTSYLTVVEINRYPDSSTSSSQDDSLAHSSETEPTFNREDKICLLNSSVQDITHTHTTFWISYF